MTLRDYQGVNKPDDTRPYTLYASGTVRRVNQQSDGSWLVQWDYSQDRLSTPEKRSI